MAGWSAEQRRNAATIISVGRSLGASQRDIMIALMAAMVESRLINVGYGDRDSVGLFQQRNAWGSRSQRMNPTQSARMFFLGGMGGQPGLFDKRNRGSMSLGQAAQAVQVSAFPNRYAQWEDEARSLLGMAPGKGVGNVGRAQSGSWTRPVRSGTMTQEYGKPNVRYAAGHHTGVDYGVPTGTPVYAAAGGKVVRVTRGGAYGVRVEIEHGGKLWTLYAHLSEALVRVGQTVSPGQLIAKSGNSGQSDGAHLHFEVRAGSNAYGNAVDPMSYLNGSTTPAAYVDTYQETTTTVPLNTLDLLGMGDDVVKAAQTMAKPYVYMNPIDFMTAPNIPIGPRTLEQMGVGARSDPEPEPTAVLDDPLTGSRLEPEMV